MTSDPNLQWDGQQWQRWDGSIWVPQGVGQAMQSAAASQSPGHQPQPHQYTQAPGPIVAPMQGGGRMNDSSTNGIEVIIAWVLAVCSFGYMLPWAIAASRGKSNSMAIGLLNFFLGWSVIGWIVALVMACGSHQASGGGNQVTIVNSVAVNALPMQQGYAPQAYPSPSYPAAAYLPAPEHQQLAMHQAPPPQMFKTAPIDAIGAGTPETHSMPARTTEFPSA